MGLNLNDYRCPDTGIIGKQDGRRAFPDRRAGLCDPVTFCVLDASQRKSRGIRGIARLYASWGPRLGGGIIANGHNF